MTFSSISTDLSILPRSIQSLLDMRSKALERKLDSFDVRVVQIYLRSIPQDAAIFLSRDESDLLILKGKTISIGEVDVEFIDRVTSVYKKVYIFRSLPVELKDSEKKEVVCLIWHLVKEENNIDHIENLASEVARLDPDDRRSVCFILSRFFMDIKHCDEVKIMMERVRGIPTYERDKICDLALELVDHTALLHVKIQMIDFLQAVPNEIRAPLCATVSAIVHPAEDVNQFCNMGKMLIVIPRSAWASVTRELMVIFKAEIADSLKSRLSELLARVESCELLSFIKIAQSVFSWVFDEDEVMEILHTLSTKPCSERLKVLTLATRIVECVGHSKIGPILCSSVKLGLKNLEDLFFTVSILNRVVKNELAGYDAEEDRSNAVMLLCHIPKEERMELVELVFSLFETTTSIVHFSTLLKICDQFEVEERELIVRIVKQYILPLESSFQKRRVLDCVFYMEKKSREDFCLKLMKFCPTHLADVDRVDFIAKFSHLYNTYNLNSLKWIFKIACKSSSYDECMQLLDLFQTAPEDDVGEMCQIMHKLCASDASHDHKLGMFKMIKKISPAERAKWSTACLSVLPKLQNENEAFVVFYALRYVPFSKYPKYNAFIEQYKDAIEPMLGHANLINAFLQNNPDCVDPFHHFLERELHNTVDRFEANELASEIVNCQIEFMLDQDSSLYQLAISVCLLTFEEKHARNPYVVFDGHLKTSLLPRSHFPIPTILWLDKYVQMNFSVFEETDQDEISFEQMRDFYAGSPITSGDWFSLLQSIQSRLEGLNLDLRDQTEEYIKGCCGSSYAELIANFNDPYLYSLLEIDEDAPVPKKKAFFGAIARFITKHSNELRQGEILSDREEAFFKMATSIQNCPAGKTEGIILAYNRLDARDKIEQMQQNHATEVASKVKARCLDLLNTKMEELISSDGPMMREMIGIHEEILQLSHQSLYVKNMIGSFIGLKHQLQFDLHTNILYQTLVDREVKDLMRIFTRYATPIFFAKELVQDFKINKKTEPLYVGYNDLVQGSISHEKMWDLSSEDFEVELTEEGALAIIEKLGLVDVIDPRAICVSMLASIASRGTHVQVSEHEVSLFPDFFKQLIIKNIHHLAGHMLPHFPDSAIQGAGINILYDPLVPNSFKMALRRLALMDLFIQLEEEDDTEFLGYLISLLDNPTKFMVVNFLTKEEILQSRFGLPKPNNRVDLFKKLKKQIIGFNTTNAFV